ncbi:MAG TPA: acyl carrier protein [Puia sp.]|jgi:acyl carrier protein|nr:acyl carrier protein [Puia sp.]
MQNNEAIDSKYFILRKVSNDDPIDYITRDILTEKLGIDFHSIQEDANFENDLGIDSLDFIEIILEIEKKFKIKISDEESEKLRTVKSITRLIKQKIK